ncbi:MAG: site-specific integrase [Planctomycetes bacterium]|nr:site-specific integrase [Planctomycetota bacterium]
MTKKKLPPGMALRGQTYWADFRVNGRRVRKSLSTNHKTARQLLIELRARTERGDFGLMDNDCRLDELQAAYLRHCEQTLKPGSVSAYRLRLQTILPHLPPRVSQITVEAVVAFREARLADSKSPGTVNVEVLALGSMLNWAVKPARLIGENPVKDLKPLPHDHPKEGRALTDDEVNRLLSFSPPGWRDVWYCFLVTGMRKEELAQLRFDDIDWEARELVVRPSTAKNHRARRLPIDDELWSILEGQAAGRSARKPATLAGRPGDRLRARFSRQHVFVTDRNTPLDGKSTAYQAFMRCCEKAGIETRRMGADGHEIDHADVHSLRRTFATHLIATGADPKTVQELLGHKTLTMTMNLYAKAHTGTKRQAVARLPWGRGAESPDHLVSFPGRAQNGHKMSTVPEKRAASAVAETG